MKWKVRRGYTEMSKLMPKLSCPDFPFDQLQSCSHHLQHSLHISGDSSMSDHSQPQHDVFQDYAVLPFYFIISCNHLPFPIVTVKCNSLQGTKSEWFASCLTTVNFCETSAIPHTPSCNVKSKDYRHLQLKKADTTNICSQKSGHYKHL